MARVTIQTPAGARQKSFYGTTRREALDKMVAAIAASNAGTLAFDDGTSLGEFLDVWLDGVASTLKPSSVEAYQRVIRAHLKPALGHHRLSKLTAPAIARYYSQKLAAGLSPASVRQHYAVLHRALKAAHKWHMVNENVASLVTPPSARRKEMHPLDPDEARQLLDAARAAEGKNRYAAVYPLAIGTGARIGELAALRWSDVDLDNATVRISRTRSSAKSGPTFVSPKSGKSRTVSLPEFAVAALRRHRTRQAEERLARGIGKGSDDDLVFPGRDGVSPFNTDTLLRHNFKPLLERAGLGDRRRNLHDLRHTFATTALSRGVYVKVVQEALGHATIAMTLDVYGHTLPSQTSAAAIAMQEALG